MDADSPPQSGDGSLEPSDAEPLAENELAPPPVIEDISIYQVPWAQEPIVVPKEREIVYFVVVVTNDELNKMQLNEIKNNITMKENRVYKNKYDSFNGKYIIEALRKAPVRVKISIGAPYEGEGEWQPFGEGEELSEEEEDETETEEMEAEAIGEEMFGEKEEYESEEYDFESESADSDAYEEGAPTIKVPLSPRDRLIYARIQEMERRNAKRIKKEINMLKILYNKYYHRNMLMLEAGEEEEEEEAVREEDEAETEPKSEEEEKDIKEEQQEEERESITPEALEEEFMYEGGEMEEMEEEMEKIEEEEYEEEYLELDLLPISQINVHLYDDEISLYEMDSYYLNDDDIRRMDVTMNALNNYNFPLAYHDYYNNKNSQAADFDEFKMFLDNIDGPLPKFHKTGTLSYRDGYESYLTTLQKQRRALHIPRKKQMQLSVKFSDILPNGEIERYEVDFMGRPTPRNVLGPPRTAASLILDKETKVYEEYFTSIEAQKSATSLLQLQDQESASLLGEIEDEPKVVKKEKETKKELTLQEVIAEYTKHEMPTIEDVISPKCEIFHIVTTTEDRSQIKYNLGKCSDESKYFVMRSCCTVIFDITRSRHDITEAWYYLKQYMELMDKKELFDNTKSNRPRHLVLITNFLTWAKSDPEVKEDISEVNFLKRKPHPDYLDYFTLENFFYKLGQNNRFGVKTTIIFSGIPYGHEEDVLLYLFKMAWDNEMEIPLFSSGKNIVPLIHIDDLAQAVVKTINQHQYPPIVFAISPNTNTLMQIAKAIVTKMGNGKISKMTNKEFNDKMCIPHIVYDLLKQNIKYDNVEDAAMVPAKYVNPFENNLKEILHEIKVQRNLNELTILFLGPPSKIKFELALLLGKFYEIPVYHKDNIVQKYVAMQEAMNVKGTPKGEEEEQEEEEQQVEEEESAAKKDDDSDREIFALKKIFDNKASNISNKWLAKCLKKLLTSIQVKNHGYILVDFPVREKDALFLFSESLNKKDDDDDDEEIESLVSFPEFIFIVEGPNDFVNKDYIYCTNLDVKIDEDLIADLDEYKYYRSINKSVRDYIERMNYRVFPFHVTDGEEIINKMLAIIGAPKSNYGSLAFNQYTKHLNTFNPWHRFAATHENLMERFFHQVEDFVERAADQPHTENVYSLREFHLNNPYQKFVADKRYDCTPIREVMRTRKPGYYTLRRHWGKKKTIVHEMPTSHPRSYWKALRKYWF